MASNSTFSLVYKKVDRHRHSPVIISSSGIDSHKSLEEMIKKATKMQKSWGIIESIVNKGKHDQSVS